MLMTNLTFFSDVDTLTKVCMNNTHTNENGYEKIAIPEDDENNIVVHMTSPLHYTKKNQYENCYLFKSYCLSCCKRALCAVFTHFNILKSSKRDNNI